MKRRTVVNRYGGSGYVFDRHGRGREAIVDRQSPTVIAPPFGHKANIYYDNNAVENSISLVDWAHHAIGGRAAAALRSRIGLDGGGGCRGQRLNILNGWLGRI